MTPRERLELLVDWGSLQSCRGVARSRSCGGPAADGDGVLGGVATVDGRPVVCFAQDARTAGGSLGEQHADTIVELLRIASRGRVPVIGFFESAGARLQEGSRALDGYARVFRAQVGLRGRVPQISVVTGCSAGGGCYSPALTDLVVMTRAATLFLTGPGVVRASIGEVVTGERLGGTRMHGRNGVAHFVADDANDAARLVRRVLGYLPQHAGVAPPPTRAVLPHATDPSMRMTSDRRRGYDVRAVIGDIVDRASTLEVAEGWARNVVTAFARLEGRSVGIIANQPLHAGGVIDTAASQKAARHVRLCDAYGVPLLVLVDTPGFMPGTAQEKAGVIRHGAGLLDAFAAATVPRISVVTRQAFGGAFIAMNSKGLGADFAFAWRGATIGVLGARQAVAIVHRRAIATAADPDASLDELAARYSLECQDATTAAREGSVDEVIEPDATRERVAQCLHVLAGDGETRTSSPSALSCEPTLPGEPRVLHGALSAASALGR